MNLYIKNDLYKKLFNKVYEKYNLDDKKLTEKVESNNKQIEECLNKTLYKLYNNEEEEEEEEEKVEEKNLSLDHNNQNILNILNNQLNNFNQINNELNKIITQNFAKTNNNLKNSINLELQPRRNSEVVLIDKEELFDNNKKSPIINLDIDENIQINNKDTIPNITQSLNDNLANINQKIKQLYELTKPVEISSNIIILII